jgi:branched-chain amino acid transport system permease protein
MSLAKKQIILWVSAVSVILLITLISSRQDYFMSHLIILTIISAALASSWNIVGGMAGQLSLGHMGFFGIGAYTSTLLYTKMEISPWLGLIVGVLLSGLVAFLVGIPTFRLEGSYYALATLALGLSLYQLSVKFVGLTNGSQGIAIPFKPSFANMSFSSLRQYVLLAGSYLIIVLGVCSYISATRLGFQLAAVREDAQAAQAIGVNTMRVKLIAGTISGGLAAGIGSIYAQYILFIDPHSAVGVNIAIQAVVLSVVGGIGFVFGPTLGAIALIPISQIILKNFGASAPSLHILIYGAVVIFVALLAPKGLFGILRQISNRISNRLKAKQNA